MRLAFAPAGARTAAEAVRIARAAEQAGLDEIWLSEDYLERGAFAVAGGVAAVTSRIGIGIGVINPWTRHVGLTAMEAAAVNEIAGGRLTLGLGASNARWMQEQLGIPFRQPIATMLDYAGALRDLLAGRPVDRQVCGRQVRAELAFTPSSPPPRIVFGVKGPRALASSTAADGVMLSVLASPPYVRWVRETFRPADITAYAMVSTDRSAAAGRDRLARRVAHFLGVHGVSAITEKAGLSAETARQFADRLGSGRSAVDLLTDEILSAVAIHGDFGRAAATVAAFRESGLDSLVVMDDGVSDPAEQMRISAELVGAGEGVARRPDPF